MTHAIVARLLRASQIVLVLTIAIFGNVLAAKHARRWDVTTEGIFSLSEATRKVVGTLESPVRAYVLLSETDPLGSVLRELLDSYRAESSRIEVVSLDPDRKPAEFLALKERLGLFAQAAPDGHTTTEEALVLESGDRHQFVSPCHLMDVASSDDTPGKARYEQAITSALVALTRPAPRPACFLSGHGEASLDSSDVEGISILHDRMRRNNQPSLALDLMRESSKLDTCGSILILGPARPYAASEVDALLAALGRGQDLILASGPVAGFRSLGLEGLYEAVGLDPPRGLVFEGAAAHRTVQGYGETLLPQVLPHALTSDLLRMQSQIPAVLLTISSAVARRVSAARATPLLRTSDEALLLDDFSAWARSPHPITPNSSSAKGPFDLAWAIEREVPSLAANRGARAVVLGSSSMTTNVSWQRPELSSVAALVESAVAWISETPIVVSVPDKTGQVGLDLSVKALDEIMRVSVFMTPTALLIMALTVYRQRKRRLPIRPKP